MLLGSSFHSSWDDGESGRRLTVWATLGWGAGDLELTTDKSVSWKTPTAMRMAAGGLRGVFLSSGGLLLAGRVDARVMPMILEAVRRDRARQIRGLRSEDVRGAPAADAPRA